MIIIIPFLVLHVGQIMSFVEVNVVRLDIPVSKDPTESPCAVMGRIVVQTLWPMMKQQSSVVQRVRDHIQHRDVV